jgi:hypothetical protein
MSKDTKIASFHMPKDALSKINLGQTFAENDKVLLNKDVFVKTPALLAALDHTRSKCFYIGRRGTGKTAIATYLQTNNKTVSQVHPELFSSLSTCINTNDLSDPRQKPFQSLVSAFTRAILAEGVQGWLRAQLITPNHFPDELKYERTYILDMDFDVRLLDTVEKLYSAMKDGDERSWLKLKKKSRQINEVINQMGQHQKWEVLVLIDRLDDSWDGSERAVMMLTALMHACVDVWSNSQYVRPLIFLRENIFERVRDADREFSRLETSVVSLDWTKELLIEMIERRLTQHMIAKPKIGETWDYFFENGTFNSKEFIFNNCQFRPRDILTICSMAIESAQSKKHVKVAAEDILEARKRFSLRLFKDLGDEYLENYPQIQLVLAKFHGLSTEYSTKAIGKILLKLLKDEEIQIFCKQWVFQRSGLYQFIELLYSIGFIGLRIAGTIQYRGVGVRSASMPSIELDETHVVVHPSYWAALDLQEKTLLDIDDSILLQSEGSLLDLPDAVTLQEQQARLAKLLERIAACPKGPDDAHLFEDIVGDVLKYCLYQYFTNVRDQVNNVDNMVRRDWIAANVASGGFWEMIKQKYGAAHIVWECKNYEELSATDFHQTSYYMNKSIGFCVVICFRGTEIKKSYYNHIRYISTKQPEPAIVIPITDKDLKVFVRQAMKQRTRDDHIQNIYSEVIAKIS